MLSPNGMLRVLVATDGSAAALEAIDLVNSIGWPNGSTLDIVTVIQPVVPFAPGPWDLAALSWSPTTARNVTRTDAEFQRHANELIDEARSRLLAHGRHIDSVVLDGRPAEAVLDRARTTDADLVVVGSHGHSTIGSMLLGSVSAEIIDRADRPVLVARATKMDHVLLAIDASDAAAEAAELLIRWPIFARASVQVVSVAPLPPPWWTGLRDTATPEVLDSFADIAGLSHDHHERMAQAAARRISAAGLTAQPVLAQGDPAPRILDVAESSGVDLIVMGTRGRTGLTRAVLGSVARNVVAHAPCSVLVAHRPAAVDAASSS